jgi:hypothetical protein
VIIDVRRRTLLVLEEVEGAYCHTAVGELLVVLGYELARGLELELELELVLRNELSYCCYLLSNLLVSAVEVTAPSVLIHTRSGSANL